MNRAIASPGQAAAEVFSVSEIAGAIGWTKRRTQAALDQTPPLQLKRVERNLAAAWSVPALPRVIAEQLEQTRTVHHYRTVADVLRDPARAWQLVRNGVVIPLARVPDVALNRAHQLQQALARALALPEGAPLTDRVRIAAEDYPKLFGEPVTDRHLRRLLTRTMERDRRAFRFERLEIYLEETAAAVAPAAPSPRIASAFPELEDAFATLAKPAEPTPVEIAFCWRRIVEALADRTAAGGDEKKIKRAP